MIPLVETCRKCGADLHPNQKVCIECGAPTPAGGGFYVEEDKKWRPTKNMKIGAVVFAALVLLAIIVNSLRVAPPDVVAKEWFDAITQRKVRVAADLATPQLQQTLMARNMDLMALADEYYTAVSMDRAKYSIKKPTISGNTATATVALTYPNGLRRQVQLVMVKVGRAWKVNEIN